MMTTSTSTKRKLSEFESESDYVEYKGKPWKFNKPMNSMPTSTSWTLTSIDVSPPKAWSTWKQNQSTLPSKVWSTWKQNQSPQPPKIIPPNSIISEQSVCGKKIGKNKNNINNKSEGEEKEKEEDDEVDVTFLEEFECIPILRRKRESESDQDQSTKHRRQGKQNQNIITKKLYFNLF
jgi:hypothetical protein